MESTNVSSTASSTSAENIIVAHVISDAHGDTATEFVRAASAQFGRGAILISRLVCVEDADQVRAYLDRYADPDQKTAVFHTILSDAVRVELKAELAARAITSVDLLGPTLRIFEALSGKTPEYVPGLIVDRSGGMVRTIDARYLES